MSRDGLLAVLDRYLARHPEDADRVEEVRRFVRMRPDCFERQCVPAHITGSAWILSPDRRQVLLTHHRKLGRWLQPGGHADGESDALAIALREAAEESGLTRLAVLGEGEPVLPLDVDVHTIPTRGLEPEHRHYDIRYLLIAEGGDSIQATDESYAVRWVDRDRLAEVVYDESVLRLERKACRLLARLGR